MKIYDLILITNTKQKKNIQKEVVQKIDHESITSLLLSNIINFYWFTFNF